MNEGYAIENKLPNHLDEVQVYIINPGMHAFWYSRKCIYLGFGQQFCDDESQQEVSYVARWRPWND